MTMGTERACRKSRPALDAIFDGCATQSQESAVRAHADVCEACASTLEQAYTYRAMLDELGEAEITRRNEDAFVGAVFASIDAERGEPVRVHKFGRVWAAAAAALVIGLVGWRFSGAAGADRTRSTPESDGAASGVEARAAATPDVSGDESSGTEGESVVPESSVFANALRAAATNTGFVPDTQCEPALFIEELRTLFRGDEVHAAREILRAGEHEVRALAARVLGPRADARDRHRLKELTRGGERGAAWALVDRRAKGVRELWDVAARTDTTNETGQRSAQLSRAVLLEAATAGRLVGVVDLDAAADPAFAALLIERAVEDPAQEFMDRWLTTGEVAWLDAWATRSDRANALADVARSLPGRSRRSERLLSAIERSGDPSYTDVVVTALRDGRAGASAALASLQGAAPVEALFGLTRLGVLSGPFEESAWEAMVAAGAARVTAFVGDVDDDARLAIEAVLRFTEDGLEAESQSMLLALALRNTLRSETRTDALLALADPGPTSPVEHAAQALAELTGSDDVRLASAAWLARRRFEESSDDWPPFVTQAFARGGSVPVQHARLARALRAERSEGAAW